MALLDGQIQVRDLLIGEGTDYNLLTETNWFSRSTRANQSGDRAWNHGSWSGAEFADQAPIPIRVSITAPDQATWLDRYLVLSAAFRPVGEAAEDVPLRFAFGGREFVLFGRTRLIDPDLNLTVTGYGPVRCGFVALDPLLYAGEESSVSMGLPSYTGGLTVPFTVPFTVNATKVGGSGSATNSGTADTGLLIRIDGPVVEPRVIVTVDGEAKILRFGLTLNTGEWLDIDTAAKTVIQNDTASRRGQTSGDWPSLPTGTHLIEFAAGEYNATAQLTATWRSAWW